MNDVAIFRHMNGITRQVVRTNTDGITHGESLRAPADGGNCMNWVMGHLLHTYEQVLEGMKQPPVLGVAAVARYARGSEPLTDHADVHAFEELVRAFDQAAERVDAGFAAMTPERLDAPAPIQGFGKNLRELYAFVLLHQAYHAGQLGVLRHACGHAGAIR